MKARSQRIRDVIQNLGDISLTFGSLFELAEIVKGSFE